MRHWIFAACLLLAPPAFAAGGEGGAAALRLDDAQVRNRSLLLYGAGALGLALYANKNWWGEGFTGNFRSIDEGWFGRNTADGGADKLGHAMANYVGTRLLARGFEWAGHGEDSALKIAAWSMLGTFTAAEVLDGFTTRWRFSKEDAVMNAVGVAAAVLMEKNPALDRLIDFRLHYRPSNDPSITWGYDPFGDYSGQIYLVVAKASGVPALRERPVLRYLELAAGYGTRGYHVGPGVPGERSRNFYYGISLNISELLSRNVAQPTQQSSLLYRGLHGLLEVFQIPGTIVLDKKPL